MGESVHTGIENCPSGWLGGGPPLPPPGVGAAVVVVRVGVGDGVVGFGDGDFEVGGAVVGVGDGEAEADAEAEADLSTVADGEPVDGWQLGGGLLLVLALGLGDVGVAEADVLGDCDALPEAFGEAEFGGMSAGDGPAGLAAEVEGSGVLSTVLVGEAALLLALGEQSAALASPRPARASAGSASIVP